MIRTRCHHVGLSKPLGIIEIYIVVNMDHNKNYLKPTLHIYVTNL